MRYDSYKLAAPEVSDLVTSCCGSEQEIRLIEDEEVSICLECECAYPDMIEEYEYEENQREWYAEMQADEIRDLR